MNRSGPIRAAAPWLGGALCGLLAACNAVLGIDAPRTVDAGAAPQRPSGPLGDDWDEGDERDGSTGRGDDGEDAGPPEIEPSPYAWPAWPMPNPARSVASNTQAFSLQSPDVVVDSVTGLEWQQEVDGSARTRDGAEAYCEKLKLNGGGFRLPSRIELLSLVDFVRENPYVDPEAFPATPKGKYWTSSRFARNRADGWLVNFEFGTTLVLHEPGGKEHFVRCVRTPKE